MAPCIAPGLHGAHQALGQGLGFAGLEGRGHGLHHAGTGQHVAGDGVALAQMVAAPRWVAITGMAVRVAVDVHHDDLARLRVRVAGEQLVDDLAR